MLWLIWLILPEKEKIYYIKCVPYNNNFIIQ